MNRRTFVRGSSLLVGAAAAGLAASPAFATPAEFPSADPDQLFRQGRFDAADRGYARMLRRDPQDAHAVAQRGYIALLTNQLPAAEKYLSRAVTLMPGDNTAKQRLAETFARQDRHARAVPLLRQTGNARDEANATLYSHLAGRPWQIHGASSARVPFYALDPVPSVEAALNGGKPRKLLIDTYSTLDLAAEVAEELGLRALATVTGGVVNNQPVLTYLGILDSFRLGNIEIRNIPMQWIDVKRAPLPDGSQPAGTIGTTVLYRLLSTMDYARRALVLRRKAAADPSRHASGSLPLWLAGDHYPCSIGTLGDYGPSPVTLDTGGIAHGLDTTVEIAERVGFAVDLDHPVGTGPTTLYPITTGRISLGRAVGDNIAGLAAPTPFPGFPGPGQSAQFGFDLTANFTHEFFKPFSVTFDYANAELRIGRPDETAVSNPSRAR